MNSHTSVPHLSVATGGDRRLRRQQVPECRATSVDLRPQLQRVGQAGAVGDQTQHVLRQCPLDGTDPQALVSSVCYVNTVSRHSTVQTCFVS